AAARDWFDARPRNPTGAPLDREIAALLRAPIRRLLARADRYYRSADLGLRYLDWRSANSIRTARRVYSDIGARIARLNHDPSAGRAFVTKSAKLGLATLSLLAALADSPRRFLSRHVIYRPPTAIVRFEDLPIL
ncbi:MAG TPA: squalene/phytoene synthase family protein, partial [Planctomycetia bacterium]|nr:squalene/phytoene synthase family protein [Planctomycetia bacterium]